MRLAVSIFNLVAGGLVVLSIGDEVRVDGLFMQIHYLFIDECSMAGASELFHVDHRKPF